MFSPQTVWNGPIPGDLRIVFHRLEQRSIPAFLVGPAVRDALQHEHMDKVSRVDIIALANGIGDVEKVFAGASTDTLFWGPPERMRRTTSAFQVRTAKDGEPVRRLVVTAVPDRVGFDAELQKREVTVNAIAMDANGGIIDPFNGRADLEKKLIRPVVPLPRAFVQRPLYLVKVAKHIAYHGFDVDDETELQAARAIQGLLDMPMERVRPELERMLLNRYPDRGLDFLQRIGVLGLLLPEVQLLVGFDETSRVHHKDIWAHTKQVVLQARPQAAIRWAALCHDIGKVWTRTIDADGKVHFLRHEDLSALLFKGIAARLAFDSRLADRIHYLIENHSRVNMYTGEWTDSAVRRLMRDTGDYLEDLLALSRADITSANERRVERLTRLLDELQERMAELQAEAEKKPLLPKGAGEIIMAHFKIPPSPIIGTLKRALEEAITDGRLPPDRPVEEYLGFLQELILAESQK